jgi:SAM-dependent methyltransferase
MHAVCLYQFEARLWGRFVRESVEAYIHVMSSRHWDDMYTRKTSKGVSWYRAHLETSLEWIRSSTPSLESRIIDIGGGASTLVDDLWALGYRNLSVLDISDVALNEAKVRIAAYPDRIVWIPGDVTSVKLPSDTYNLWHDRAVFHFLTEANNRNSYVKTATGSVRPGGFLIVATFALDGPPTCSGLPVARYSGDTLVAQFPAFRLVDSRHESHRTPSGAIQNFTYCLMKKVFPGSAV